jgi:hypothetical protein
VQQYIIDFVNGTTDEDINEYLAACGATVVKSFSAFEKLYLVEATTEPSVTDIVERVIHDSNNHIQLLSTVIVADSTFGEVVTDGSVPMITVDNADKNWWKLYSLAEPDLDASEYVTNRRGSGSIVYVLDSGVDFSHPEFDGVDTHNLFSFNNDFTDNNGHGTALASVIAGKTCSITNATVKSVKIFDSAVPTKQSDMLNALEAIHQDYSASNAEHYIVNASWSIPKNEFIENKIRELMSYGIFFVVAAGNSGQPISDVTPASMLEVLTIGSYNSQLLPSDFTDYTGGSSITYTSGTTNHGELDGFAPGEMIWAATLNGGYGYVAGTSIAAAIQSAALAYNFATGFIPPIEYVDMSSHLYHRQTGLGRRNLLDLSDPKYSSSNNQVTTYFDVRPSFGSGTPYIARYKIESGGKFTLQFFNPNFVKQVEFLSDLPQDMLVTTIGKMSWIAPEITNSYEVLNFPIIVTYTDDTVVEDVFKLVILHESFDSDTTDMDDITLSITLQADCNPQSCRGAAEFCNDNCGIVSCSDIPGDPCAKEEFLCLCAF